LNHSASVGYHEKRIEVDDILNKKTTLKDYLMTTSSNGFYIGKGSQPQTSLPYIQKDQMPAKPPLKAKRPVSVTSIESVSNETDIKDDKDTAELKIFS